MDVTDASFERDVVERSAEVPVVVDLWAEWCGPCRTLGPILEKVIGETGGRVELAKVDVDANPRVAATFQVQSIPAVFAVSGRQIVDSFIGALPEAEVRRFVERLAPAESEADKLAAAGDEASLRAALDIQPDHPVAVPALAELLAGRGEGEEALALLQRVPETAEVRRIAALARLAAGSDDAGAGAGSGTEEVEAELERLLDRVKDDDDARRRYVDLLEVLGPDHPRTAEHRRRLTSRLF